MMPNFQFHVFICQNERSEDHPIGCCAHKGARDILTYIKKRVKECQIPNIRINKSGCLGQCSKGPAVVVYPNAVWYTLHTTQQAEDFIQEHLLNHTPVQSLMMQAE